MIISHIVAIAKNHVIGKENDIPWRIPGEQLRFKELTMNKTIVMGRKTYESIGKKLVDRNIVIISRTKENDSNDYIVARSVAEALENLDDKEVFIVGGGKIYQETLMIADKLYLTELDEEVEGDIFYPQFDKNLYRITHKEYKSDATIPYTYLTYEKK